MAIFQPVDTAAGERRKLQLTSPVTLEPLYELECQTAEEVNEAVARARAAQPAWAAKPLDERVKLMLKLRDVILDEQDYIVDVVVRETGKPMQDAIVFEVFATCAFISYWAKQAKKTLSDEVVRGPGMLALTKKIHTVYKPRGVVGVIAPWNGPFVLTANPCIQAMIAGNTVVAKGSEVTPWCSKILEELCVKAGIPKDVCQVLMGDGETGAALTAARVDKIAFTGSVATGKKVAAACSANLVPFSLELGGKDAMIVCADADIDQAAHGAVWGGCVNTGHYCCGVERIYVEEPVYDQFVKKTTELAASLKQGQSHGLEEDLGAVFWDRQLEIMEAHVEDAVSKGARVLTGGRRNPDEKGLYYEATVMVDVDEDWDVMRQETFGPVLPIVKVKNVDEAVEKANDSDYGLHGSVWTKDAKKGLEIAKRVETGSMAVNDIGMMYGIPNAPFAGVKESGMGGVNGPMGLRAFTHALPIVVGRYGGLDSGYPYDEKKFNQMKTVMNFLWKNPIGRFFFGP